MPAHAAINESGASRAGAGKSTRATNEMENVLNRLGLANENNPASFSANGAAAVRRSTRSRRLTAKNSPACRRRRRKITTQPSPRARSVFEVAHNPGPVRGETVRRLGNALREVKNDLGQLVTLETGKIIAEGEGEVQEMIDICDFAVGQSRMLYGLTIQSERPNHRLMEQWHPLGVVAVISAFNFPVAVWSWNAALAAVCGDATVWKPSEKTPLTAIAVTKIAERVCRETGADPAIFTLLMGDRKTVGQKLSDDKRIPLISATGSTQMGVHVAQTVHGRLGKTIMELGGNNALIVARAPISKWRRNRFSSARSVRRVSGALQRGASSCMNRSPTRCARNFWALTKRCASEIRSIGKR